MVKLKLLSLMQLIALDTGLFASDILSTLPNPTIAFVIPTYYH
jgi:hypothetical protein